MRRILHLERQFDSTDALKALKQGMRVRFIYWPDSYYIEYSGNELVAHPDELREFLVANPMTLPSMLVSICYANEWELYTGTIQP